MDWAEDRRALSLSQRLSLSRVSLPKAALGRRANQTAAVCITGATPPKVKLTEREQADCLTGPSLALKPCNRSISPANNSSEHFPHQTQTPHISPTQPTNFALSLKQPTLHKYTIRQNV
jgi:hypothetical protein